MIVQNASCLGEMSKSADNDVFVVKNDCSLIVTNRLPHPLNAPANQALVLQPEQVRQIVAGSKLL